MRRSLSAFPSVTWRFRFSLSVLLAAFLLAGCDETSVLPFAEHENYFTVFGYLDAASDSQMVRVIPIRLKLDRPGASDEIDGEVYLHALDTGTTRRWSLMEETYNDGSQGLRFDDGSFGFVFLGRMRPVPGQMYELEVRRKDGKTTRARTTVPVVPAPTVEAPREEGGAIHQTVVVPGMTTAPAHLRLTFRVFSPLFDRQPGKPVSVSLSHDGEGEATAAGWRLNVNLTQDARAVRAFIAANLTQFSTIPAVEDVATFPLTLQDLRLSAGVRDEAWDFVVDDPDLGRLAQPGAASNVENGFGFFGALGWGSTDWELARATAAAIGL